MTKYACPICSRRACDSNKSLFLEKLSDENANKADMIIKCHNCKNALAVSVQNNTHATEEISPQGEFMI